MSFLNAIENSALVDWFLTSMWGFPVFIALHSVGMAFVVGLSLVISLRYLGFLQDVSVDIVKKLIIFAWLGFMLNLITGIFLLMSRASEYLFDPTFLIKLGFVALGAIGLRLMQRVFETYTQNPAALERRFIPIFTMFCWFGAVTAGRWIAYLSGLYS